MDWEIKQYMRAIPTVDFFEKLPLITKIKNFLIRLFIIAYYTKKFESLLKLLHVKGIPINREEVKKLRLKKMYVAGALGGFLASDYTNPSVRKLRLHLLHADIFGYWSNYLIAADAAMDFKVLDVEESIRLLTNGLLGIVTGTVHPKRGNLPMNFIKQYKEFFHCKLVIPKNGLYYRLEPGFRFENYAVEFAVRLGMSLQKLAEYYVSLGVSESHTRRQEEFIRRTLELHIGQLDSLQQSLLDDDHDWGWYIDYLNRKTMNVLLAPLSLFTGINNNSKSILLQQCFLLVNSLFFHRGVLDDLMDLESDINDGLANTLPYMIVSQGRVAERTLRVPDYLSSSINDTNRTALLNVKTNILSEISRSCLLPAYSWAWRECKSKIKTSFEDVREIQPNEIDLHDLLTLVIYTLANSSQDFSKPLSYVISTCIQRKHNLLEKWRALDLQQIIGIIIQSRVVSRILDTIADSRNVSEIEEQLRGLGDPRLRNVFQLFYQRTRVTYKKVLKQMIDLHSKYS